MLILCGNRQEKNPDSNPGEFPGRMGKAGRFQQKTPVFRSGPGMIHPTGSVFIRHEKTPDRSPGFLEIRADYLLSVTMVFSDTVGRAVGSASLETTMVPSLI